MALRYTQVEAQDKRRSSRSEAQQKTVSRPRKRLLEQILRVKLRLGLDTRLRRYSTGGAQAHLMASFTPLHFLYWETLPWRFTG